MPTQYFVILGICVATMALSAWHLGDEDRRVRGLSRVGLVLGGTGLFVSTIYYASIFVAALVIAIPLVLIAVWWGGLWS